MKGIEVIAVQIVSRYIGKNNELMSDHTVTVELSQYDRIVADSACDNDIVTAIWKAVTRCVSPPVNIDSVRINKEFFVDDGEYKCTVVLNEICGGNSRISATGKAKDSVLLVAKVITGFYSTKNVDLRCQ